MRPEIQAILDKEWPDRRTPKGRPMYGAHDKQRALILVALRAEDSFDMELYDEAIEQAGIIPSPYEDEDGEFIRVTIPGYHRTMHSEEPKLLIFKEKHGTWYFVTNNATEFSMALLSVISDRVDEEWYLDELYGDDLPKEGEDPDQTDMFKANKKPLTDMAKAKAIVELARSGEPGCVIGAGKRACEFLMDHGDGDCQYEDFDIEYPSAPTFDLTPS